MVCTMTNVSQNLSASMVDDYLRRSKERALEYVLKGELIQAVASIGSDLNKHEETRIDPTISYIGIMTATMGDVAGVRRFIDGFRYR